MKRKEMFERCGKRRGNGVTCTITRDAKNHQIVINCPQAGQKPQQ
jgi:hypothetical protein